MKRQIFWFTFLFSISAFLPKPAAALEAESDAVSSSGTVSIARLEGLRISRISITARRVREDFIRTILPVKEGDAFTAESEEKIRHRLNDLRFFKKIEISSAKAASGAGVNIDISLEDGWFLIPIPFVIAGSGGTSASLILVERNYFRLTESLYFFGGGNPDGAFGTVGGSFGAASLSFSFASKTLEEITYANGAANSSGRFRSSRSISDPERYGALASRYDRTQQDFGVQTGYALGDRAKVNLEFSSQEIDYENLTYGRLPADAGRNNQIAVSALASLTPTSPRRPLESAFSFQDFGSLLGFGLADLADRIKPLGEIRFQSTAELTASQSARPLGSDFSFSKAGAGLVSSLTLKDRQRISWRVRGMAGLPENLPLSQKVATNRELGLRGSYAREFRGARGAGSSLVFTYPFRRTTRGAWTVEAFGDAATVWESAQAQFKEGVGFGFGYQFWRFPIPLGFTYTYSIDDREPQVSFALGGRF